MKNFIERLEELQNALRKDGKFAEGFNVARNAAISIYNELHPQSETIAPEPKVKEGSFKVRVTRCESGRFWYKDKIGEVFEVIEHDDYGTVKYCPVGYDPNYIYPKPSGLGLINKSDCEIIPETTVIPFDYKRWKDGDFLRVVTRDGMEVTQLVEFKIKHKNENLRGVVEDAIISFFEHGGYYSNSPHTNDLHLEISKPKQVTTYHYVGKISGLVVGVDGLTDISQIDNLIIGETITEQQPDGTWKIISTTLK